MALSDMLRAPVLYELLQAAVGARAFRRRLVREVLQVRAGMRIADVGCGPGGLLDYLPSDVDYVGFDASERYVWHAQRRYRGRGRFLCCTVGGGETLPLDSDYDLVLAIGVLHHLSDVEVDALCEAVSRHLTGGGSFVAVDPTFVANQPYLARWVITRDRGGFVRTPCGYAALAERRFPHVETAVRGDFYRIPFTHCVLQAWASK